MCRLQVQGCEVEVSHGLAPAFVLNMSDADRPARAFG